MTMNMIIIILSIIGSIGVLIAQYKAYKKTKDAEQ
jgi:hypothetical protein